MKSTCLAPVRCGAGPGAAERTRELIGEAPVLVRVEAHPYTVLLCTPGEQGPLAAGFCLSDGIIAGPQDLAGVECDPAGNAVRILLAPDCRDAFERRLAAPGGRPQPDLDLIGIGPMADGPVMDPRAVRRLIETLDTLQPLRAATRAAHAAALYDEGLSLLAAAEDVGRHNALDKAVGKLLLHGGLDRIRVLVLSSRISFEMVSKAARARAAVVAAVSRPTALAVDLARRLNMTLATPHGADGLCVYCGSRRLGLGG